MKKMILVIMTMVMMVVAFSACGHVTISEDEPIGTEYAKTTVVVEVDYTADEVHCVDFNGDEWVFTGCEDWMVGDYCSMVMNDMGTENIYDDEIVSCRYDGWLDGTFGLTDDGPVIEIH